MKIFPVKYPVKRVAPKYLPAVTGITIKQMNGSFPEDGLTADQSSLSGYLFASSMLTKY
jgi:hypothetical protein